MLQIHSSVLRMILLGISVLGIAFFLLPLQFSIINIGNLFGLFMSILLFVFTAWNGRISKLLSVIWEKKAGRITLRTLGILFLLGVLLCLILSVFMIRAANKKPQGTPQAVVVLGCKVRGTVPSLMLWRRIQAAYDALQAHPDAVCVVSGGKGDGEEISEAQCMSNELQKLGVSADRILLEDQSTSTSENLRFSKKILADTGITGELVIVTDGFHERRAQYLAKREGITETAAASAETAWYLLPTYWVREWFGLVHAFVLGS